MRRRYIVISSFFVAVLLLSLLCFGSYRHYERIAREEENRQKEQLKAEEVGAGQVQKITAETKYIVEIYNRDTEELVREVRTMPSEYAGMTRQEVEKHLALCQETMSVKDWEAGVVALELISFSKDELVIRKTCQEPKKEEGFLLKLVEGEVVIFHPDGTTVYEETGIREEDLLPEEIKKLEKGFPVKNEKDLYSILENFSS